MRCIKGQRHWFNNSCLDSNWRTHYAQRKGRDAGDAFMSWTMWHWSRWTGRPARRRGGSYDGRNSWTIYKLHCHRSRWTSRPAVSYDRRNSRTGHKQYWNCSDVCVLQPTKLRRCHITYNNKWCPWRGWLSLIRTAETSDQKGFRYVQASTRSEIKGAASVKLRISAGRKVEKQRLYHVYVGKLKENTSKKAVLDHLHDIGVSHVSDVIQLHRKTGGQASFCVSVDNSDDEDAMYNPDKWPAGALIRPYKLRTQTTRNQQTTRDQRPPRPRTHQEPRARSYRLQAAARSSDRPTEYTRARDSYDSGQTHYSDDTDNTRARNRPDVERRRVSYRPYSSYNSYWCNVLLACLPARVKTELKS